MACYKDIGFTSGKYKHLAKKLVSTLDEHLGIDVFFYYSISNDGEFRFFTSHSDQSEYFWENDLFKGHPHLRHPRFYRPGQHFTHDLNDTEYDGSQGRMQSEQDIHQMHLIFDSDFDTLRAYGFATTRSGVDLRPVYCHQGQLLRQFAGAFLHQAPKSLFQDMESRAIDLEALDPVQFHTCPAVYSDLENRRLAFLRELQQLAPAAVGLSALSPRELQCAYWLIRGRSASETAQILGISARTVECHVRGVKNKLSVNSKKEVFDLLQLPLLELSVGKMSLDASSEWGSIVGLDGGIRES